VKTRRQIGGNWITRWRRLAIYLRDRFTCQYCGRALQGYAPENITLDHLDPHSNGGGDHAKNLVTACKQCNSARGVKPWRKYATGGAIVRIQNARRRVLNEQLARSLCGQFPKVPAGAFGRHLKK
jgi:5-methylcytosine-specific restriction endonuclease McrA